MSAAAHETIAAPVTNAQWQRLSVRVVWIDVIVTLLSLLPGAVAIWVIRVEASPGVLWPLAIIAVLGVVGAVGDIIRWAFTKYRVTSTDIERRTGVFVKHHRTLHRDRVRSVDSAAKLRHRLAGLRVVTVGAGQQTGAGEAALVLDALSREDAAKLRTLLIDADSPAPPPAESDAGGDSDFEANAESEVKGEKVDVFATFKLRWVVYNMFNIWAYLMAAGLLWGGFWLASTFGFDVLGFIARLVDWGALGWVGIVVIALLVAGAVGAVGLGINFLLGNWHFELARVSTGSGSYLRTRRGLLSTREVNRDESRMRGMSIGEPLLWRWMGMADTNVITTGLSVWDPEDPTAILPRGPITVAKKAARNVFGPADPMSAPLTRHPRAALRRRLWWATATSSVAPLALMIPAIDGVVPIWMLWAALGFWPLALAAAVIAYRALGHAISGDYLVVRSGLLSRTTSALRRDAVSTIVLRQSVLQRRLDLCTVSAMTAAGWSAYEAPDVQAQRALTLAVEAAPGLLDEFIERGETHERG